MASVLRPRRGKRSVAIANSIVLRKGEVFFEVPENGVGTGAGKIKMGDGVTGYEQLPYFSDVDISNSPVRFTEAEDADVNVLLNTISSGNPLNTITGASKRLLRKYDQMIASKARSVNGYTPDVNGNINLQKVPLADNIYSPDNVENFDTYIYRTTAGSEGISSGEAQLSFIKGNSVVSGRVAEQIDANYTSQHTPEPEEVYTTPTVAVDHTTWRSSTLGSASGTYTFTYDGSVWKYNSSSVTLSDYGITVTGDVYSTDSFNVVYVKANQGTITVAKPTAFKASGLNWFDKSTMTISGYTLDASGNIVASSGSTVGYIRNTLPPDHSGFVIYNASSTLTRVGWKKTIPAAGTTGVTVTGLGIVNNPQLSYVVPEEEGYIIFAYTGSPDVCAHASWSGGEDVSYADYTLSTITIPTKDVNNVNLPTATYGMPSVGGVADTLSFDLKMYTQYIGQMAYSAANLATVQAMGVDYDYDSTNIFYVLPTPNTFYLATEVSGVYECHDYGSEWFECSTTTPIVAEHLYGQNLRDKLRHDVVTISPMTGDNALTDAQKATFRSNIGAASAADVTQLNNESVLLKVTRINTSYVEGSERYGWFRVFKLPNAYMQFDLGIERTWSAGRPVMYHFRVSGWTQGVKVEKIMEHYQTAGDLLTGDQIKKIRYVSNGSSRYLDIFIDRLSGSVGGNTYYVKLSNVAISGSYYDDKTYFDNIVSYDDNDSNPYRKCAIIPEEGITGDTILGTVDIATIPSLDTLNNKIIKRILTATGDIKSVIPFIELSPNSRSTNQQFVGTIYLARPNNVATNFSACYHFMIGDAYASSYSPRVDFIEFRPRITNSGTERELIKPCLYKDHGTWWAGLKVETGSDLMIYIDGTISDQLIPYLNDRFKKIDYYNNATSTVIDPSINSSIVTDTVYGNAAQEYKIIYGVQDPMIKFNGRYLDAYRSFQYFDEKIPQTAAYNGKSINDTFIYHLSNGVQYLKIKFEAYGSDLSCIIFGRAAICSLITSNGADGIIQSWKFNVLNNLHTDDPTVTKIDDYTLKLNFTSITRGYGIIYGYTLGGKITFTASTT